MDEDESLMNCVEPVINQLNFALGVFGLFAVSCKLLLPLGKCSHSGG